MLVRLALWGIVLFFAYLLFRRTVSSVRHSAPRSAPLDPVSQLVQDPHCGIYVDRMEAVQRKVPGGTLFFCSEKCANAHLNGERAAT